MSMRIWVGVTDTEWYRYLAKREDLNEVNFWKPSGRSFHALRPGELFLFKLKAPYNAIAGGGFFVRYLRLPLPLAWDVFGPANGAPSLTEMRRQIARYQAAAMSHEAHEIGCIVLAEPFFLTQDQWIPAPDTYARNVMAGKQYHTEDGDGARLYHALAERLAMRDLDQRPAQQGIVEGARYGEPRLVTPRLGQAGFRALVGEAYGRRCAITGERTLPVLEAAHIQPYAAGGPHAVENGLFLRSDLHRLFDRGYITINPDDRALVVSARIREEFHNGHDYYRLEGRKLLPTRPDFTPPARDYLQYHADHIYLGA
jgi:putative restriction endonuclease